MRDWEPDLTTEWRRLSSQRWDRRRSPRAPSRLLGVIVILAIVFGLRYLAMSAEPASSDATLSFAVAPVWQREVWRAPRPVVVAQPSQLDRLWSRTEKARARGDVQAALRGLRTIAEDHPEDARTPKAAFMLATLTNGVEERCLAFAMVVGLAPASDLASDARQRLPLACAGASIN